MKRKFVNVIIFAFAVAGLYLAADYFLIRVPQQQSNEYIEEWINKFQSYDLSGSIPSDWKDDVYIRKLNDTEWILAAMYHGACAPGPRGQFDASVLIDSTGKISSAHWSPCAAGIEDMVWFWGEQYPALTLSEVYSGQIWRAEQGAAANP